jgi:hypothetical protein
MDRIHFNGILANRSYEGRNRGRYSFQVIINTSGYRQFLQKPAFIMDIQTGRQRTFPAPAIVAALLLSSCIVDQFWFSRLFPFLSGLFSINPTFVFLDIPVQLPLSLNIPLLGIFSIFYSILILSYASRMGDNVWEELRKRLRAVYGGMLMIGCSMICCGLIFYWAQDYLPRRVRNGIDSFGLGLDIRVPYPGNEVFHLRGSMLLLLCFVVGLRICLRKTRRTSVPVSVPAPEAAPVKQRVVIRQQKPVQRREVKVRREKTQEVMTVHEKLMRQEAINRQELRQEINWPDEQAGPALCRKQPVPIVEPVNYRSW